MSSSGSMISQSLHIFSLPEGMMENRALPFGELKLHPHRFQGDEDIGEDNGRIELELLNGLERHLRRQFGVFAHFQERVFLSERPVLLHITPCLAHQPDGGIGSAFSATSP